MHLNKKEHKCEECGKSFGQKAHLSTHLKAIHLNRKDHKCEVCGKYFGSEAHLSTQVKAVHLSQKDRKCEEWKILWAESKSFYTCGNGSFESEGP